jgi:hypothetical protein
VLEYYYIGITTVKSSKTNEKCLVPIRQRDGSVNTTGGAVL